MLKNQEYTLLQKIVNFVMLATVLLAPLKMGAMILPGVPQGIPQNGMELVLNTLPVPWLALGSGVLFALSLIAYGAKFCWNWRLPVVRLLILWMLLPLAALIGFVNADSLENPVIELEYTLFLSSFAGAFAMCLYGANGDFRRKALNCICIGTILTAFCGVYQYFFGFEDMKNFIAKQEKNGIYIAPELKARALDVRTFATFTFASALAGMFALAGALTASCAWNCGKKFDPPKVSQRVFLFFTVVLCGGIFLTTKGRSAFLAVTAAAALCGFVFIKSRKLKVLVAAGAALVIVLGACYIHYAGRGFGSMTERVGYLKSTCQMIVEHPFCGGGWGGFTYHHALNKNFGNEELAKDPHNFVASFASQTGIFGGALTLLLMAYGLAAAYKNLKKEFSAEKLAIFFGLSAFSLHMLMDLDWQVAGLMIWYAVMTFCGAVDAADAEAKTTPAAAGYAALSLCGVTALLTCIGGVHWSMTDKLHYELLDAAGQHPGAPTQVQNSYVVEEKVHRVLRLAPYSHSVYMVWANDALRRMDLNSAEARYNKVMEMTPRSSAVYDRLGDVYKLRGDELKAAEYYDKADKLFPYKKIFFEERRRKENQK